MKTAKFTNFSDEAFVGYWDGKPHSFAPGISRFLPDYLAAHFAKHLTNRELIKEGMVNYTSPKRPEDVPQFMELYTKAYSEDTEEDENIIEGDDAAMQSDIADKNRKTKKPAAKGKGKGKGKAKTAKAGASKKNKPAETPDAKEPEASDDQVNEEFEE